MDKSSPNANVNVFPAFPPHVPPEWLRFTCNNTFPAGATCAYRTLDAVLTDLVGVDRD